MTVCSAKLYLGRAFLFQEGLTFRMLGYVQYAKLTLVNNLGINYT